MRKARHACRSCRDPPRLHLCRRPRHNRHPPLAALVDPALIDELVTAGRILADQGVLDAYGHVSMRHPGNPNRYLLARAMAPAIVTAADVMEYDLDSNPVDRRDRGMFLNARSTAKSTRRGRMSTRSCTVIRPR